MPLDSNVNEYANHIPAAVRRQAERAEQISQEVYHPVTEEAPAADPVVDQAPAAEAPVAAPVPVVEEDFKQKYLTLQGKYNSEVPGMRAELEGLRNVIATMQSRPAPVAQPKPEPTTVVVDDKDVEEFGADLIAKSRKWARAELADLYADVETIKASLGQVQQNAQQVVQQSAAQSVMAHMDNDAHWGTKVIGPDGGQVERWRVVNEDPIFLGWLQKPDTFSGQHRLALLRDAFSTGNSQRMKAFFDTFVREQTVTQTSPASQPGHTSQETAKPTLESFAMPGRQSGSPQAGASNEKRVWSQQDITAFYRDINAKRFDGREAEKTRLEADLFAAMREGRIR